MNETVNYDHKMENDNVKHILNSFQRSFITVPLKLDIEKDNWNVRFRV
jgi:hypothetical protein